MCGVLPNGLRLWTSGGGVSDFNRPDSVPMSMFTRRSLLQSGFRTAAGLVIGGGASTRTSAVGATEGRSGKLEFEQLEKSQAEWRELLAPRAYEILRKEGTERAYTSQLNDEKRPGIFLCAACLLPLFDAKTKFDSGTGWPSFWEPIKGRLKTKSDYKLVLPRTEYHCGRCGGHQGHIFKDGPPPTGERWCNNGLALRFILEATPIPQLRS